MPVARPWAASHLLWQALRVLLGRLCVGSGMVGTQERSGLHPWGWSAQRAHGGKWRQKQ